MHNPCATIPATLLLAQAPMSANAIIVATKERTGFADEISATIAATAYHSRAKGDIIVASLAAFCLEYYHFRLVGYLPIVLESAFMQFAVYRNALRCMVEKVLCQAGSDVHRCNSSHS